MMDPTERRRIGATDIAVSRLGIGGGSSFMRAGDEAGAVVSAAWGAGLRYFDTAALYGGGQSEQRFGQALAGRPRGDYVVSTKAGQELGADGALAYDYSEAGIRASVQRSCERLGSTSLDIVFLHDVDPDMHGDAFERRFDQAVTAAYGALAALREEGTLRAIGVGLKDWTVALRLARAVRLDCIMLAGGYTLLQHGGLRELLPWCLDNGVGVVLAAPFNSGILATGARPGARYFYAPAPPDILERTRRIEAACARHAVPLPAVALQFPLHHPAIAGVVVGHERAAEVERNVQLVRQPIPGALWSQLKDEGLIPAAAPTP